MFNDLVARFQVSSVADWNILVPKEEYEFCFILWVLYFFIKKMCAEKKNGVTWLQLIIPSYVGVFCW